MAKESAAVANNLTASVVINHIVRESEYYIGIAKAYLAMLRTDKSRFFAVNKLV